MERRSGQNIHLDSETPASQTSGFSLTQRTTRIHTHTHTQPLTVYDESIVESIVKATDEEEIIPQAQTLPSDGGT